MSGRRKLVESEKTQNMVMAAWKQKELLQKEIKTLDSNCDLVVDRITVNQKLTYIRFKEKLQRSQLSHARIMGDKQTEKEMRLRKEANKFNTSAGMDADDREVLEKIWSVSKALKQQKEAGEELTIKPRHIRSAPPLVRKGTPATGKVRSHHNGSHLTGPDAGRTCLHPTNRVAGVSDNFISTGAGYQFGVTTVDKGTSVFRPSGGGNKPDTSEAKTSNAGSTPPSRPHTGHVHVKRDALVGKDNPTAHDAASQKNSMATSILGQGRRGPSLLEVHRRRIKSAGWDNRVQNICSRMKTLQVDEKYLIPDYYAFCRNRESAPHRINKRPACNDLQVSEAEVRRSFGDPGVRSLTLKQINSNDLERNHIKQSVIKDDRLLAFTASA